MTNLVTTPRCTACSPNFRMRAAILLGAALAIGPTPVLAEMQVRGSPEAVRIDARDTPVEEILAALRRAFGMHIALTVVGSPKATVAAPTSSAPKVVQQPAGAIPAARPPSVAEDRARPGAPASTAAPSPAVELAEGPSLPTPSLPKPGSAPAPVPELKQSEAAPAPAPPAPGSKATAAPVPGPLGAAPPPVAGPTPSAPSPGQ